MWKCTNEIVLLNGAPIYGGGSCTVTDADKDKFYFRWQIDESNKDPSVVTTIGTYHLGEGKYAGLTGGYNLSCVVIADTGAFMCDIIGGQYQIP